MKTSLYFSPGACSFAPHVALIEIGLPFELIKYSTMERENYSEEYLAVNPKGRIPALSIDDFLLTENPAILAYLGRRFSDADIYPANASVEEARCLEWLAWSSNTVHVAFAQLLRPERFVVSEDDYPVVQESGKINFRNCLSVIDQHLKENDYAVGGSFTVVDPFWLVFFRWGIKQGYAMNSDYRYYTRYIKELEIRPSIKQALVNEGISIWE